jgi:TatD DNase family protein
MPQVFDTHAHLQDPAFTDVEPVLRRAADAGLVGILLCGYDAHSNQRTLEMSKKSALLFAAVGFHPHEAKDITPAMLTELEIQAALPNVVAVGEIGLDFFRDHSPHDVQRTLLDAQLGIAARLKKPVSVHTRSAEEEIFEPLAIYSRARGWAPGNEPVGVMHCFGGTLEQARQYVEIGFLISLACVITYPGNTEARTIAAELPLESLVVETDSPYLPPQPLRGRRNEPAHVVQAVQALARARGITFGAAAEATTANAVRVFGIQLPVGVGAA